MIAASGNRAAKSERVRHYDSGVKRSKAIDPRWSPDGKRLVFVHEQVPAGTRPGLQVMIASLDGSRTRALRRSADDFSPEWSPDGRRIAFLEDRFPVATRHV
jgi:Tol biopolymer transport system component